MRVYTKRTYRLVNAHQKVDKKLIPVYFDFFLYSKSENLVLSLMSTSDRLGVTMHPAQPDK